MLTNLSRKLGTVGASSEPYFRTRDPESADYQRLLDLLLPAPGEAGAGNEWLRRVIAAGRSMLPA